MSLKWKLPLTLESLFCSFLYHCHDIYKAWLSIWVERQVSSKNQELLTLLEHLGSPAEFLGTMFLIFLGFCGFFFCSSSSVLCTCCCQFLWIVQSWLPVRFSLTFAYNFQGEHGCISKYLNNHILLRDWCTFVPHCGTDISNFRWAMP
jgi:hypothetical protein